MLRNTARTNWCSIYLFTVRWNLSWEVSVFVDVFLCWSWVCNQSHFNLPYHRMESLETKIVSKKRHRKCRHCQWHIGKSCNHSREVVRWPTKDNKQAAKWKHWLVSEIIPVLHHHGERKISLAKISTNVSKLSTNNSQMNEYYDGYARAVLERYKTVPLKQSVFKIYHALWTKSHNISQSSLVSVFSGEVIELCIAVQLHAKIARFVFIVVAWHIT